MRAIGNVYAVVCVQPVIGIPVGTHLRRGEIAAIHRIINAGQTWLANRPPWRWTFRLPLPFAG
jgi:hypothetical protein